MFFSCLSSDLFCLHFSFFFLSFHVFCLCFNLFLSCSVPFSISLTVLSHLFPLWTSPYLSVYLSVCLVLFHFFNCNHFFVLHLSPFTLSLPSFSSSLPSVSFSHLYLCPLSLFSLLYFSLHLYHFSHLFFLNLSPPSHTHSSISVSFSITLSFLSLSLSLQCIEAYRGVACMDSVSCFPEGRGLCGFLERLKRANRCQFSLSNTPEER